jgi:hypothetical protein
MPTTNRANPPIVPVRGQPSTSKPAFFMLLVALALVGYLNYRHYANAGSLLRAWADASRFRLLHARPGMPPRSMLLTTSKSQVVYHVSVHDESSHRIRAAWVRLGTRFWGVMEGMPSR